MGVKPGLAGIGRRHRAVQFDGSGLCADVANQERVKVRYAVEIDFFGVEGSRRDQHRVGSIAFFDDIFLMASVEVEGDGVPDDLFRRIERENISEGGEAVEAGHSHGDARDAL